MKLDIFSNLNISNYKLNYPNDWINYDFCEILANRLDLFDMNSIHLLFYVSKSLNSHIKKNSNKFWDKFAFKSEINIITNHSGMIFDGPDGEAIEIQKQSLDIETDYQLHHICKMIHNRQLYTMDCNIFDKTKEIQDNIINSWRIQYYALKDKQKIPTIRFKLYYNRNFIPGFYLIPHYRLNYDRDGNFIDNICEQNYYNCELSKK